MNIDDLTLGQVKELKRCFLNDESACKKEIHAEMLGKVCMVRTYSAGVHFGILDEKEGQSCLLKKAQRIFYWTAACSLSQLAMEGSKNFDGCKISMAVDSIVLDQVIEVILMPISVVKAFREADIWKK